MTDIYIAIIYVVILAMGFKSPFIFSLGFVWVDVFAPQLQSSVLTGIPVSLIVGILAFVGYMISDRRDPPKLTLITVLIITMAGWITLTSTWGVAPPQSVWGKWDWAFKVLIFSAFLPFVFRTRIQIEAFYQVLVFAASVHFVSGGLKTLAGGGGYGSALSVIRGNNTGIYEGSTMAAVAIMIIPILFS